MISIKTISRTPWRKEALERGCSQCGGDLELTRMRQWLSLFGKPVVPLRHIDHYFICSTCKKSHKPSVKYLKFTTSEESQKHIDYELDIFGKVLIASLAYTALADGKFSLKEDELLEKTLKEGGDYVHAQSVLETVFKLQQDARAYVFSLFNLASQVLTSETLMNVVVANARMVLVDGKIKKSEQKLLREYLRAAGLPVSAYYSILERAHEEQFGGEIETEKDLVTNA